MVVAPKSARSPLLGVLSGAFLQADHNELRSMIQVSTAMRCATLRAASVSLAHDKPEKCNAAIGLSIRSMRWARRTVESSPPENMTASAYSPSVGICLLSVVRVHSQRGPE